MIFNFIFILLLVIPLFIYFLKHKTIPKKIFNVYSQPGKWYYLKFLIMYLLLSLRKLKSIKGKTINDKEEYLEKMKSLSKHEKAFDATFFHAVSQNGFYIVGGLEKRHQAKVNGLLYIVVPEIGLLESENLPKTSLDADPKALILMNEWKAEGLAFGPVIPMKEWKLNFKGRMKLFPDYKKFFNVTLISKWTSDLPYFNLQTDMNTALLAKAIAVEPWSKRFFKNIKENHQIHYEQMGYLNGELNINGKRYKLEMSAFRDHSFGHKRDWMCLHRYAFFMLYLEDNTRISFGVASQYNTVSHITMGYIVLSNKKLYPIESSDFRLFYFGEKGQPEKNINFSITAGGLIYDIKTTVIMESFHYKGNDIEAKLYERFIECNVNGIKGRGVSEWQYNNN